jgi:hypothetical protein
VTSFAPFLQAVTRLVDNGTLTLNQLPFLRYPSDSLKINDQSKQECGPEAAVLSGSLTGTNAPVTVKMFSTGQGGDDSSLVIKLTNELVISMFDFRPAFVVFLFSTLSHVFFRIQDREHLFPLRHHGVGVESG